MTTNYNDICNANGIARELKEGIKLELDLFYLTVIPTDTPISGHVSYAEAGKEACGVNRVIHTFIHQSPQRLDEIMNRNTRHTNTQTL